MSRPPYGYKVGDEVLVRKKRKNEIVLVYPKRERGCLGEDRGAAERKEWDNIAIARRRRGRAAVVVLGELGLSPRMQYHALSLSRLGPFEVDVVCYGGADPHSALMENPSIHLHEMIPVPFKDSPIIPYYLKLLLKLVVQFFMLLWFTWFKIPPPDVFIVQNPTVPAFLVIKWISWLRRSPFIVDWHNIGYTHFGFPHGKCPTLVVIYQWFEKHLGRMADGALCVSKTMKHELAQNWGINAEVVYDHPTEFFSPITLKEKHEFFCRLRKDLSHLHGFHNWFSYGSIEKACSADDGAEPYAKDTLFTFQNGDDIFEIPDRPAIIVSATSWTKEKDFSTLLEAAVIYDSRAVSMLNMDSSAEQELLCMDMPTGKQYVYPRLLFIIIGPEREKYEEQIRKLHLKHVTFLTLWSSVRDYPSLLGSADLGVWLQTSSSGPDLPITIMDMFGCGLPVCAASCPCIEELIDVWSNGLLFSSPSNLADILLMLFKDFPYGGPIKSLRMGALAKASSTKWDHEWIKHAKPVIDEVIFKNLSKD